MKSSQKDWLEQLPYRKIWMAISIISFIFISFHTQDVSLKSVSCFEDLWNVLFSKEKILVRIALAAFSPIVIAQIAFVIWLFYTLINFLLHLLFVNNKNANPSIANVSNSNNESDKKIKQPEKEELLLAIGIPNITKNKANNDDLWKMGMVIFKIFLFSLFTISCLPEPERHSDALGLANLPLVFSVPLIALAVTMQLCMISVIMAAPAVIIGLCLEKIRKKETTDRLYANIAILLSSLFIFHRFLTPDYLGYSLLFIILIIPFENIKLSKIWPEYKGVIVIWGIAAIAVFFIIGTFKYLERRDSPSSYSPHQVEYEQGRKDYTIVNIVDEVYICTGTSAKTYHKDEYCRGLNNCSGEIECISRDEAEELGRRKCRICY